MGNGWAVGSDGRVRVPALDGLRGLAALTVALVFHYRHFYTWGTDPDPFWFQNALFRPIVMNGSWAVDVFFLISGVIFTYVYYEPIRDARVSGRDFFILRFARLYPLHLVTTLLVAVLVWISLFTLRRLPMVYVNASDAYHLVLSLLLLQTLHIPQYDGVLNFPSWSLCMEAMCYCIFFCIARFTRLFDLCCLILVTFGTFLLFNQVSTFVINWDTGRALLGFFAGCLIARGLLAGLGIPLCMAALFVSGYAMLCRLPVARSAFITPVDPFILAKTTFLPALVIVSLTIAPLRKVLSCRLARRLGELSFGIYMVHISVQCALIIVCGWLGVQPPYQRLWFYLVYCACVLGLAELAYRYLERPAQRWIRTAYGVHSAAPSAGEAFGCRVAGMSVAANVPQPEAKPAA